MSNNKNNESPDVQPDNLSLSSKSKTKQWFTQESVFIQGTASHAPLPDDADLTDALTNISDPLDTKPLANRALPEMLQWLLMLEQHSIINSVDYHFSCFVYGELTLLAEQQLNPVIQLKREELDLILLLAAKLSFDVNAQNACVNLNQLDLTQTFGWLPPALQQHNLTATVLEQLPPKDQWQTILLTSQLVEHFNVTGNKNTESQCSDNQSSDKQISNNPSTANWCEEEDKPLVLFQGYLYMRRYFHYEMSVVDFISQTNKHKQSSLTSNNRWFETLQIEHIKEVVDSLFMPSKDIDWQKQAVLNSINKAFSVISGGPGTGKTTTVVKLLAALGQLYKEHNQKRVESSTVQTNLPLGLNIQLAAPTGKAAQRLAQSIGQSLSNMTIDAEVAELIPNNAVTIHRLLKPQGLNNFKYNKNNKLFLDVLILDEASMVDLSLMSKLLDAVPEHAQVILLGDKQQLSSVETGNVLSEICDPNTEQLNLVVELKKSYRFDTSGLIGELASQINQGNSHNVVNLLSKQQVDKTNTQLTQELNWIKADQDNYYLLIEHSFKHQLLLREQADILHKNTLVLINEGLSNKEIEHRIHQGILQLFDHLQQFQILTCVKEGEFGIEGVNHNVKKRLASRNLFHFNEQHFHCRPIMISENAYHLGLYNGDIGLQLIDNTTNQLTTYFIQADGELKKVACQRLPTHETVYAMTVHKSQGSEFQHVALVLPEKQQGNKVLSREILYTGLTRARKKFTLFGNVGELQQAVNRDTQRQSGLSLLLQQTLLVNDNR